MPYLGKCCLLDFILQFMLQLKQNANLEKGCMLTIYNADADRADQCPLYPCVVVMLFYVLPSFCTL